MVLLITGLNAMQQQSPYYATLADWGLNSAEEIKSYSFDTSNLSKVVNFHSHQIFFSTYMMFNQCRSLTEVNMVGWDLSNVS